MSELIVEVVPVLEVKNHPNADRLDLIRVKGWEVIVKRDQFTVGNLVVFIPPDAIITKPLQEFLNITNYCAELPKSNPLNALGHRRVKAARLRGIPSYGVIMTLDDVVKYFGLYNNGDISDRLVEGSDLSALLNITKYEPPIRSTAGDVERDSPQFHTYTDIENWRNHPEWFSEEDQVVITQKIHGTNCRLGYCLDTQDGEWKYMAGSHKTRRKDGLYWEPYFMYPQLRTMIEDLYYKYDKVPIIVFGEIFGSSIQDITYGMTNGQKDFMVFDISVGGTYVSWPFMIGMCKNHEIPTVPILWVGPYSVDKVKELTDGPAFKCAEDAKFKGREGVVIKPYIERVSRNIN